MTTTIAVSDEDAVHLLTDVGTRRAPRITQTDVFRTADELLLAGHRPTIDRVRMRLGRGSPNTINDHLDEWWAKLGSRLRDLPGQEFPQLPERVSHTLQQLWNQALADAHEALQGALQDRERALLEREAALEARTDDLAEREQAAAARAAALEDSLALAREQLIAANHRALALEASLQEREAEGSRLRARIESVEADWADCRHKLDSAAAAHQTERVQLEERYTVAERHWLHEVDRARQHAAQTADEHQKLIRELRRRVDSLTNQRDELRENLLEARSELKTATAVREQLEERLRAPQQASTRQASMSSRHARHAKRPRRAKSGRRTRKVSDMGNSE